MTTDQLFMRFVFGLLGVMSLFGIGMIAVIFLGETAIGSKMVTSFVSMFAGVLGLGSGYILGRAESAAKANEERRPHEQT